MNAWKVQNEKVKMNIYLILVNSSWLCYIIQVPPRVRLRPFYLWNESEFQKIAKYVINDSFCDKILQLGGGASIVASKVPVVPDTSRENWI